MGVDGLLGACVHDCVCVCEKERELTAGMYANQDFTKWLCCTKSNATVTNTCTDTVVTVTFLNIVTTCMCDSCFKVLVMHARVYERACYCAS